MSEEVQEEIEVQGPGAMLKARRESLRLSIEDIAEKLHLRPAVVAELEDDIIDHAVSMTFTKGYVRLYAKHMEMDPTPVLAAFDALANPIKQPAKLQSFSQRVAKQASDTRLMMLSYSILFVVIAMAVIWWFQQPEESQSAGVTLEVTSEQEPQPVSAEPEVQSRTSQNLAEEVRQLTTAPDTTDTSAEMESRSATVEAVSEASVNDEVLDTTPPAPPIETDTQRPDPLADTVTDNEQGQNAQNDNPQNNNIFDDNDVARELAQDISGDDANIAETLDSGVIPPLPVPGDSFVDNSAIDNVPETAASENFSSAQPITQELVFTFAEDCWMNLTDATGENIAYGTKKAGRVMPVTGIPPFEVVLGTPQGVAITVDGIAFDMSPFPAGRTARFTIGNQSATDESPDNNETSNDQESLTSGVSQ